MLCHVAFKKIIIEQIMLIDEFMNVDEIFSQKYYRRRLKLEFIQSVNILWSDKRKVDGIGVDT